MAGEVISIGSGVSSLKVGDRVAANRLLAHIDGELLTSMVRQSATGSAIDGVLMEYRTFPAEVNFDKLDLPRKRFLMLRCSL